MYVQDVSSLSAILEFFLRNEISVPIDVIEKMMVQSTFFQTPITPPILVTIVFTVICSSEDLTSTSP